MRNALLAVLTGFVFGAAGVDAAPRIKVLKLSVANPTDLARPAENVVIAVSDLKAIAPDFTAAAALVTTSGAATLEADAHTWSTREVPSQADDLDGDDRLDEIAFQVDLAPHQKRILTIAYGAPAAIARLRADYPRRTQAAFRKKYEGPGWESELYAWRLYFDARNAIDLFGKRRPGLLLDLFGAPEYDYHAEGPFGRDIYKNGDAIGIGSAAAWVSGAAVKVADVKERTWRVAASGPVRSVVELRYSGWSVDGRSVDLTSWLTQWAGERGFEHRVQVAGGEPVLITALPRKPGIAATREQVGDVSVLRTWGHQVLEPGATATASLPDQNLGLAVLVRDAPAGASPEDPANHVQLLAPKGGQARWYVMAAWDQEGSEAMLGEGQDGAGQALRLPHKALATEAAFTQAVSDHARAWTAPATVTLLSKAAAPQAAPPDTLAPARHKSFREAVDLLRQSAEATAPRWLPKLQKADNAITRNDGEGYFMEADAEIGEWRGRRGYNWTGSFWVGLLWRLHDRTNDRRFREWAEAWNAPMLGQEGEQNHDTGFLNYYASAFSYDRTKDAKYRESALRSAARLQEMFHPAVGLIPTNFGGNDTIIDTLLNLEILWWAAKTTGEERWRTLGRTHAQRAMEWLVRPDGSVAQSVHYNPGDAPQEFRGPWTATYKVANDAKPGEWVLKHTHQGFAADTAWSRGTAWALYGFARAHRETGDPAFLATARRVAAFVDERLPEDGVPWYDFHDEGVHYRNRDTSAAAILAAGLLHLADATKEAKDAARYRDRARTITQSLIDRYLTPVYAGDKAPPGYLRHGCGTAPQDGPLIFGHYYLLEALQRLEKNK